MHGSVVAEVGRQLIPLTPRTQAEEDAIQSPNRPDRNRTQLFLSAIVTSDGSSAEFREVTYPALSITTEPVNESNHTPAWDEFMIPID